MAWSEGTAYKRMHAARAAQKFPVIFELVAAGDLHLSGVSVLAPKLTEENHQELLAAAKRRSKRQIEELVAKHFPSADAPTVLRRLPMRVESPSVVSSALPMTVPEAPVMRVPVPAPTTPAVIRPLSEESYRLQVTLKKSTREKVLRLQSLMRHSNPNGDVADIIDTALTLLLDQVERRKFGKRKKDVVVVEQLAPGKVDTSVELEAAEKRTRHIPNAIKRAVVERDGAQCSFVSAEGRRCAQQSLLEFHHQHPFAKGGPNSTENVRILCAFHNAHCAELDFGAGFMARRRESRRKSLEQPLLLI